MQFWISLSHRIEENDELLLWKVLSEKAQGEANMAPGRPETAPK